MANTVLKNGGAAYVPPDLLNDTSTPDLNPDYFDIVITDLKPDTDYAIQLAWVFEDKTLSPYSASYDLHTDAITIPEVTNIATEWSKNDLIITFNRPEETVNGVITGLADSYILTLTYGAVSQKIPFNANTQQTSQKYTLTQSKAEALWPAAVPNQYTGLLQVVNLDGTSTGVSFTTASLSDGITDQDISDSSWAITSVLDGYIVSWAQFTDAGAKAIYDYTEVYQSTTSSGTYSLVEFGKSPLPHVYYADLGTKYIKIRHKTKRGTYSHYSNVKQIKSADPSGYDANGPTNEGNITAGTPEIDGDGLFDFNYKVPFSWTQENDATALGYRLRWRIQGSSDPYTYTLVPGLTTTTTYLFGVLAGQTYEVGKNTYDEYGNTTAAWKTTTVTVPAFTGEIKDGKFLAAGDMKLGYGIGNNNTHKGLYLSPHNYWYVAGNTHSDNAAYISVGSADSNLVWNGTDLTTTGIINALGGTFTGFISVGSPTVPGQLRVVETFDTNGTTPLLGIELGKFSSAVTVAGTSMTHGIYAYNKNTAKYVLIDAADGSIRSNNAYINGTLTTAGKPGNYGSDNTLTISGGKISADTVVYLNSPYIDLVTNHPSGSGKLNINTDTVEMVATTIKHTGTTKFYGRTYIDEDQSTYVGTSSNPTMRNIWIRPDLISLTATGGLIGDVWIQYA